jgi:hypothetical protein
MPYSLTQQAKPNLDIDKTIQLLFRYHIEVRKKRLIEKYIAFVHQIEADKFCVAGRWEKNSKAILFFSVTIP